MERRVQQRFAADTVGQTTRLEISGDNIRFLDFSEHGFSFSSSSLLSVGDRFELQLIAANRDHVFLSALICNRRTDSSGSNRYGAFFDLEANQFEDHKLYLDSIGITPSID